MNGNHLIVLKSKFLIRIPPKILKTNNETKATLDKQTICLNNQWDKWKIKL